MSLVARDPSSAAVFHSLFPTRVFWGLGFCYSNERLFLVLSAVSADAPDILGPAPDVRSWRPFLRLSHGCVFSLEVSETETTGLGKLRTLTD